jgi:hypothetical protein
MTQLTLDQAVQRGRDAAVVCLANTRQTHQDWPELALAKLREFCRRKPGRFTSEDAVAWCYEHGLERAHDDRAFGQRFLKLAREGTIRKTTETYRRTSGHGSPAFKWEAI